MSLEHNPLYIFGASGGIASFAGLAALLRSGKPITVRSVLTAMLNSGIFGLAIGMLWYSYFQNNAYFLVGLCALAGLGGVHLVDFVQALLRAVLVKKLNGDVPEKPQ